MDQGLPSEFNTTSTLADVAPALYGANVGMQTQTAQDNNLALQRAFQANEDFQAQKRPLDLAFRGAETKHMDSNSGYLNALARGSNLTSDEKVATMPGEIGATNAKNQTALSSAKLQELENHGQIAGQVAAQLRALPPGTPGFMVAPLVRQAMGNLLPDHPGIDQSLSKMDPQDLAAQLEKVSTLSFAMSSAARAAAAKEQAQLTQTYMQGQTQRDVAKETTTRAEEVAKANIQGRLDSIFSKSLNSTKDRAAALRTQASKLPNGPEKQQLLAQAKYQDEFAAHLAEIGAQAKNETGITASSLIPGTTPPRSPSPAYPMLGREEFNRQQGAIQTEGAAANGANNQQDGPVPPTEKSPTDAIKKAFGDYNPDKYEYGINPATGKLARRLKGQ